MNYLLRGLRAGMFAGLLLSIWSFIATRSAMGDAMSGIGLTYAVSAYGLLGAPQIIFGALLGGFIGAWGGVLGEDFRERLRRPKVDLRSAAILLSAPVMAGVLGAGVGLLHLAVTSKFVQPTFQALGLVLGTVLLSVGVMAASAPVYRIFYAIFSRLFPVRDAEASTPRATSLVLGVYAIGLLVAAIVGYQYAMGLKVWSATLVRMALAAMLLTPLVFGLMQRVKIEHKAWRFSGLIGALVAFICLGAAYDATSSSAAMRRATTRDSALFSKTAMLLQPLADRDGDGFAGGFGGNDCDDSNPDIYPGAHDIPNNGIDESCSGADAAPPKLKDSQGYKTVHRAINTAHTNAANVAANIPDPPPNLVMILVDTLRVDHLGFAGYERDTSPNIDALARESVFFEDAYAPAPHTPRSIPMLFFSRYPNRLKWYRHNWNYPIILPENLGFFEVLQEAGYKNVGMSSHFYFKEEQGIRQGFTEWDNEGAGSISESNDAIASPAIWKKVEPKIEELAKAWHDDKEQFSLFVHLFDPHARWIPHADFDFGKGSNTYERHVNAYDSEIAFSDSYVGGIIEKLKSENLYEDTIVVITSDHGEGFNEHGYYFHGQTLYNEILKVPLIIRVPGWHSRRVKGPVSLVDVAPTLLELFKVSVPSVFEGQSLVEAMLGRSGAPKRPVFAQLLPYTNWKEHHEAIILGDEKFIMDLTNGVEEYYDLANDPGEQENLRTKKKERADELKQMLNDFMQAK
ncbi:sulfatase-like hydrolase/transferase [Bradymonas sediminis]|uniref:Uncharacterized protein n=1 Tax=Bradymonas sediminis TaxID=1548548 RepID=A0A2Z4FG74_9DELT|nr:sulfatase-like hydrolase/transferase [Bradymonas sediminis]AWV87909.1 hypothetical protein DN745_00625 [Bradymonas sediminis]TDP62926.1 arylsulfatase A-like enzyme [Bradymonas sediminis]